MKNTCPNKTPFFTHESVLIVHFPHPPSSLTQTPPYTPGGSGAATQDPNRTEQQHG
jgi:hypothetical protein